MRIRPYFSVNYRQPARTTLRWIHDIPITTLLIVIAVIAAAFGFPLLTPSSSTTPSPIPVLPTQYRDARSEADGAIPDDTRGFDDEIPGVANPDPPLTGALDESDGTVPDGMLGSDEGVANLAPPLLGGLGVADGAVPDGMTVFDDSIPGVANLNPVLLSTLRQAATDAAYDGVAFFVESGWRSPEYQNWLLLDAVSTYGSEAEAARWVATPETSAHVSGGAVDIGPYDAIAWLSEHGAAYGLCQIYSNEPWHYELRPDAKTYGCPPLYADPTQDPRMQQ